MLMREKELEEEVESLRHSLMRVEVKSLKSEEVRPP